ncbi:MAG: SlyX family protein [Methylophaga sp.]|nr:SlyX family protein [Methylophaga sp.]
MNDDIVDLQTRLAFQDGLLEQLNEVVTSQQQQIDRLESQIAALKSQMDSMHQTQLMQQSDEPPPPHY